MLAVFALSAVGPAIGCGPQPQGSAPQFTQPLGIIRYDAWSSDTDQTFFDTALNSNDPAWKTDYANRIPVLGWSLYGTGINSQTIADTEIQEAAAAGVDFFWYLHYPPASVIGSTGDAFAEVSAINTPLSSYLTSAYKSQMQFAVMYDANWLRYPQYPTSFGTCGARCGATASYTYLTQFGTEVGTLMTDSQYVRINGRPLFGLFASSGIDATHWATFLTAVEAANGGVVPYVVDMNHNTSQGSTLGEQGMSAYGPNPSGLSPSGQHAYSDQVTKDKAIWTPAGFAMWPGVTAVQDARPRGGSPAYADLPTMPEWVQHVREAGTFTSSGFHTTGIVLYAWDEWMEGGPGIAPTTQEGTRFLDGIKWAKHPELAPSTYTYEINSCNIGGGVSRTGAGWSCNVVDATYYQRDEDVDSTTNDTLVFTHVGTTGVDVTCKKGPDRGQFGVQVDGGGSTTVDAYAASPAVHQTCWSSGALTEATHTITVTILGTKNASSSSVQVGIDSFRVTADPRTF